MPNIKIHTEDAPSTDVFLKLIVNAEGDGARLIAVDSHGHLMTQGTILEISPVGIIRCPGVSKHLGFTTTDGLITLTSYEGKQL